MRAFVPRLAAALAVAWGAVGCVLAVAVVVGAQCAVDEDAFDQGGYVTPALIAHVVGGVGLLGAVFVAAVESAGTARDGWRALGLAFAVALAHIVALAGLLLVVHAIVFVPLFGPTAIPAIGAFFWVALTSSGGGWSGLLVGALAAARARVRWVLGGVALVGLAGAAWGFGLRAGLLVGPPVGPAALRGTVVFATVGLALAWSAMALGGLLTLRATHARARHRGLALATVGASAAGIAGVAAYALILRSVMLPLPAGTSSVPPAWLPSPAVLADAIQQLAVLLPVPLCIALLGALAWIIDARAAASADDGTTDSEV